MSKRKISGRFLCRKERRQSGISIPELMVTIAVAGILGVTAVSSYKVFKEKSLISGGQWLVYNLLMRTRTEAITQGRRVSTADLLSNPTGTNPEATTLTEWIQQQTGGCDFADYTVYPDSIAFDGRGMSANGSGDVQVSVSVGSKSGTVLVSAGGIVSIP